jgi:ABC-2 type transport system ATP-binding protein
VAVIAISKLTKHFGAVAALDGLDLIVNAGEIHGFLGPNGAGKTTTIRILLGMVRADGGEVSVLGRDPWGDAVALHAHLAFVPGEVDLWGQLTGKETLSFLAQLRGGVDEERERRLTEHFELDTSRRVAAYSKGNRQKVALVAALASGADLFLFDEPTDGLDPLMVEVFREEVSSLRDVGATVLLSSHLLSEVEEICDRVTILRDGRTVEAGTLDSLRHLARLHVQAETVRPIVGLDAISGLANVQATETTLRCDVDADQLDALLGVLRASTVRTLECRPPSLESIFLSHYASMGGAPPA